MYIYRICIYIYMICIYIYDICTYIYDICIYIYGVFASLFFLVPHGSLLRFKPPAGRGPGPTWQSAGMMFQVWQMGLKNHLSIS